MKNSGRRVLLAPLDPVHDVGIKMIRRALDKAGHQTVLLQPDLTVEEIVDRAMEEPFDCLLISRTIGYGVEDLLVHLMNVIQEAGLRDKVKVGIGGMGIRPELAMELGFDQIFGPGATAEDALAFVENRPVEAVNQRVQRIKSDMTQGYSYQMKHDRIGKLLNEIACEAIAWTLERTTAAVERAQIRQLAFLQGGAKEGFSLKHALRKEYASLCDPLVRDYYLQQVYPSIVQPIEPEQLEAVTDFCHMADERAKGFHVRHTREKPTVFIQYGTGSLFMDVSHMKVSEAWGAEGVIHFDPAWGARAEGLLEGYVNYKGDGTVITPHNLFLLRSSLDPGTLFQVRAHRGLNSPETVLLAGEAGADLTKINIAYGSLGAGTDPARLTVDGITAMKYAAVYKLPFDIVTNEELCGVPAYKAFAGMLINCQIGVLLGGRPILQPLFCHSPDAMITGKMKDNYIDFNAAKVKALRAIIDAPIWPGAPIGFMTHTEDRVQSAITTSLHAALGASLQVDGITIASSDEAYSGGPITAQARIDTLRGVRETFRFLGRGEITATPEAGRLAEDLVMQIEQVLEQVKEAGFVEALYRGILGSPADGAYPGRAGRGTVKESVYKR
ncbi:cobalamin B12-binding domain-containing protein [Paenibacillus sp. SI8]|uniref:cobalamin B12-binding domain-containing protein n=1 Tax=unclassified Paenibacillus TaxID=185978 RepID=UPI003467D7A0